MSSMLIRYSLLIAVLVPTGASLAADQPPRSFAHDARIVHDLCRFDFSSLDGKDVGNWAVFSVQVGPITEAAHQQLLTSYQERPVWPLPVTARPLHVLAGAITDDSLECVIEFPNQGMLRAEPVKSAFFSRLSPSPIVMQFTAICRLGNVPGGMGRRLLYETILIPADWAEQVKPALDFWRKNRTVLNDKSAVGIERLREISRGKNPIIAILACRAIAAAGKFGVEDVASVPAGAGNAWRSTAFLLLLQTDSDGANNPAIDEVNKRWIDPAKDSTDFHILAVACALAIDATPNSRATTSGFELAKRIAAKAVIFTQQAGGKADPYLTEALAPARRAQRLFDMRERAKPARDDGAAPIGK